MRHASIHFSPMRHAALQLFTNEALLLFDATAVDVDPTFFFLLVPRSGGSRGP